MTDSVREKRLLLADGDQLPLKRIKKLGITAVVCRKELFDYSVSGIDWLDIDDQREIANVQEAYGLTERIYTARFADGSRVSQEIVYRGHELLWYFQQLTYASHVMPFLEWRKLLEVAQGYDAVLSFDVDDQLSELFGTYCEAFGIKYQASRSNWSRLKSWPLYPYRALTRWVAFSASLLSLPFLMLGRPKVLLWQGSDLMTNDDHDFRLERIYRELRERNIAFVEAIRATRPLGTLIRHMWIRRRPVIYHNVFVQLGMFVPAARYFRTRKRARRKLPSFVDQHSGFDRFLLILAIKQFHRCFSLQATSNLLKIVFRGIGIRVFVSTEALSRNADVILACKLAGVPTVGIQSGNAVRHYVIDDFLPGFEGAGPSPAFDLFGLWSSYWRDYVVRHSDVYREEDTFVAGHIRPVLHNDTPKLGEDRLVQNAEVRNINVLLISEPLTDQSEIAPYLEEISQQKNMSISIKCRPERNDNIVSATRHIPGIALQTGTLARAYATCDVVLGSHSTAILEGAVSLRPMVFLNTRKWGDYYETRVNKIGEFAEHPRNVVSAIHRAFETPANELKRRRNRLWGDTDLNGAESVANRVEDILNGTSSRV